MQLLIPDRVTKSKPQLPLPATTRPIAVAFLDAAAKNLHADLLRLVSVSDTINACG